MKQYRKRLLWFGFISALFLNACSAVETASPSPVACPPEQNAYITPINQNLINIYENAVTSVGNTTDYNNIRQQAFNELVNHVYYLSDSVDIETEEKTFRITITHINPELVHIIVVNHYLFKKYTNFSGRISEQMNNHLSGIIERNEHVFFITFTASSYVNGKPSTVSFPLRKLKLTNTDNTITIPEHDDHNLEVSIVLENGPDYGFAYFPMAVIQNGNCQAVLDKNRDTRIVLSIPNININDTDMGAQSWEYKYAPLIDMRNVSGEHQNLFSLTLPADQLAPRMSALTASDVKSPIFWADLARIIWLETTLDP